jgi:hypothetical protein
LEAKKRRHLSPKVPLFTSWSLWFEILCNEYHIIRWQNIFLLSTTELQIRMSVHKSEFTY